MAPAAPSLAGAMMGLGEGVAAFHPLLLSVFPEVSVSFFWVWREAKRCCDRGLIISWPGGEVWERAFLRGTVGRRFPGRGGGRALIWWLGDAQFSLM